MSDQHRAVTALQIVKKYGFKFNTYEDGTTDYTDEDGFVDAPEDLAGSIAEFFDEKMAKLQAENEALKAKLKLIEDKFKSGNSIPVERITLTRDEFLGDKND